MKKREVKEQATPIGPDMLHSDELSTEDISQETFDNIIKELRINPGAASTPEELSAAMKSPVLWAEAMLKNPNTFEPFKCNYTQHLILDNAIRFNAIRAHRRSGKCVAASEYLTLADGSRVQAGDLIGKSFQLLTLTESGIGAVDAFADFNAIEEVYAVETESGRRVVRNAAHPFYTASKYSPPHDRENVLPAHIDTRITSLIWI